MKRPKSPLLKKVVDTPPQLLKGKKLTELVRVYQDLERTLHSLRRSVEKNAESSLRNINVRKLMIQLARSKRRIERKIANTILLEKQHLKKRFRAITTNLHLREDEG